jgi:cytochrome c oxidase assembly factor CtaG
MFKRYGTAVYRLFFAGLVIAAVVTQLVIGLDKPTFKISNFFSFFTIESNILAALIFLIAGCAGLRAGSTAASRRAAAKKQRGQLAWIRGAATFYMTATGIIYALLLSGLEESLQTATPWVNTVLHYVMPVAVLADWLVNRPERQISAKQAMAWLVFPVAYVGYSLVRGHITGWYPYPFLNPGKDGYLHLAVTCIIIGAGLAGLAWLLARSTRSIRRAKS